MIKVLVLLALVGLCMVWWLLKRKHDETFMEILITCPFDSLKVGKVAIFRSGSEVKVGDFVLIRLPGYEMIWKVVKQDGEKLGLKNRNNDVLEGFPKCHLWGKMIGYKGEVEE